MEFSSQVEQERPAPQREEGGSGTSQEEEGQVLWEEERAGMGFLGQAW